MPRHLITWKDWSDDEIKSILNLAINIKKNPTTYASKFCGKTLVMLFQKTSTRTRVSFEAGMTLLGGHAINLDWASSNFGLTRIKYEAGYLSTNANLIMARMVNHEDLLELKEGARIPVINGCCNRYHPCQAMADMLTIAEDRGTVEGARLTYIGVHNNVVNSLMAVSAALGVKLTLVCPLVPDGSVDQEIKQRLTDRQLLTETLDLEQAVKEADYVYTDTWIDMEYFNNPSFKKLKEERLELMLPFQINEKLMKGSSAKIMHDMPIHSDYEITDEMVWCDRSIIFQQSGNRLPVQQAIMLSLTK